MAAVCRDSAHDGGQVVSRTRPASSRTVAPSRPPQPVSCQQHAARGQSVLPTYHARARLERAGSAAAGRAAQRASGGESRGESCKYNKPHTGGGNTAAWACATGRSRVGARGVRAHPTVARGYPENAGVECDVLWWARF